MPAKFPRNHTWEVFGEVHRFQDYFVETLKVAELPELSIDFEAVRLL